MQLRLVKERLVATLGIGSVVVLLDKALVNLSDGLLCGCLLKNSAPQVQVVRGNHLHAVSPGLHNQNLHNQRR